MCFQFTNTTRLPRLHFQCCCCLRSAADVAVVAVAADVAAGCEGVAAGIAYCGRRSNRFYYFFIFIHLATASSAVGSKR